MLFYSFFLIRHFMDKLLYSCDRLYHPLKWLETEVTVKSQAKIWSCSPDVKIANKKRQAFDGWPDRIKGILPKSYRRMLHEFFKQASWRCFSYLLRLKCDSASYKLKKFYRIWSKAQICSLPVCTVKLSIFKSGLINKQSLFCSLNDKNCDT